MCILRQVTLSKLRGGLAALTFLSTTAAEARVGDWGDPILISALPFTHSASTSPRASLIDSYSCAPQLSESGPEVLYRLDLSDGGVLSVQLEGDNATVDVDIHLLSATSSASRVATSCLARNNRALEQSVSAGTYYLAVDSYAGATQAGPYTLRVTLSPDDGWSRRPVANGVTLETKRYDALFGGNQFGSVLRVDLSEPGVEVKPVRSAQCQTTSQLARSAGAVAAINGGYFDGVCGSVSLVKIDGQLFNTNARSRSAIGFTAQGSPMIDWIEAGRDWPSARHALGGLSRLAQSGAVQVEWERDSATYSFTYGANPRTGVGIGAPDELILATLDGRTAAGAGVSLFDFGQWLVWVGAREALNLDGGGSTTLWTSLEEVVNYPSDNGVADHAGERPVASILAVFAPPLQRETEWVVRGESAPLSPGERLELEVFARDPDGELIALSARSTGAGQLSFSDLGDGGATLSYTASSQDPAQLELIIEARVGGRVDGTWRQALTVIGGGPIGGVEGPEEGATEAPEGGAPLGGYPEAGVTGGVEASTAGQAVQAGVTPPPGGAQPSGGAGAPPVGGAQGGSATPPPVGGVSSGGAEPRPLPPPLPSGGTEQQRGGSTPFVPPASQAQSAEGASCEQAQGSPSLWVLLASLLLSLGALARHERLNRLDL